LVELANIDVATSIRSNASSYSTPQHSHDNHAMLLLPLTSTMTVNDESLGARRLVERDYFYYVEAGLAHNTCSNRIRQEHIAVYLNKEWQSFLTSGHGLAHARPTASGIWRLSETGNNLSAILARKHARAERDPFGHLGRLVELLAEDCLLTAFTSRPELLGHPGEHGAVLVREAIERIRADLAAPPSLDDLAAELDISRRHLTRLFRDRTGVSVAQFIRSERHREAARLIRETEWSIQQIASQVGLDNSANFATSFRREFGATPSEYRSYTRLARN